MCFTSKAPTCLGPMNKSLLTVKLDGDCTELCICSLGPHGHSPSHKLFYRAPSPRLHLPLASLELHQLPPWSRSLLATYCATLQTAGGALAVPLAVPESRTVKITKRFLGEKPKPSPICMSEMCMLYNTTQTVKQETAYLHLKISIS